MAQTGIRARIGDDIRYLEATDDKPAVAYVRLAEAKWERDSEGNFTELEPEWHNGVFRGRQADLVRDFEKGDSLLVLGNFSEYESLGKDGKTYTNIDLNVNHFAPDLTDRAVTVSYDRSQRTSRAQVQDGSLDQDQEAHLAAENSSELPMETVSNFDSEIMSRLQELVKLGRINQDTASATLREMSSVPVTNDPETYCKEAEAVARRHLAPSEAVWVGYVPRAVMSNQQPPTWQQAQVMSARQEVREPQPQQTVQQDKSMSMAM